HQPLQVALEQFDVLALLADDHAGPRRVDRDAGVLRRALDQHAADRRAAQLAPQVLAHLDVVVQRLRVLVACRVPARRPVAGDRQPESGRMNLLSHLVSSGARAARPRAAHLSATVTKMWHVCFSMRAPRPLARAAKRRIDVPFSTWIVLTFSSSMSAPSLCSALAIADSSTLRTIFDAFFGENSRMFSACSTGLPRTRSATSRPF